MTMIRRLFSSFDPIRGFSLINNSSLIPLIFCPILIDSLFTLIGRNKILNKTTYENIQRELNRTISNSFKRGKPHILMVLFFLVLLINLRGLIPYVFTASAHIRITLTLILPFWLGFILFRITHNKNHFFRHLVPLRTPLPLSQFIVIIETVSQLIRPITLSVRLAANITAGHILMGLARSNITIINISRIILIVLLVLEGAVAFIQSYVFTILISIYINEA